MIYTLLKQIFKIAFNFYYKSIEVRGLKNIPENKPIIFVANHPNAFIDPLILAVKLNKNLHFLSGAEWMGKGFFKAFVQKFLRMIPVYRPWVNKNKGKSNKDMFLNCYEVLAKGGNILIFPEGTSVNEQGVRKIKTGASRIMRGARDRGVRPVFIPIGLIYSNPQSFYSSASIQIGEAIPLPESVNEKEWVYSMTDSIRSSLSELIDVNTISDEKIKRKSDQKILKVIYALPLWLVGIVINFIPFVVSKQLYQKVFSKKMTGRYGMGEISPAFTGSIKFMIGITVFGLYYVSILIFAMSFELASLYLLAIAIYGLITGKFTLNSLDELNILNHKENNKINAIESSSVSALKDNNGEEMVNLNFNN